VLPLDEFLNSPVFVCLTMTLSELLGARVLPAYKHLRLELSGTIHRRHIDAVENVRSDIEDGQ